MLAGAARVTLIGAMAAAAALWCTPGFLTFEMLDQGSQRSGVYDRW
jgi:hypothetical protein